MSTSQIGRDRVVGERKALLYPNRPAHAYANVDVENRYPCTTILIHGVNDLGTDFGAVESGLCEGLNDRLGRAELNGGEYTHGRMANDPSNVTVADLMKNLDDVIYRRQEPPGTKSVVIPFYWGFKASASDLAKEPEKQTKNGQYIDKFGNRLDSHRAKGGGMFANATTNIPDMFDSHFLGGAKTWSLDTLQGDLTHPLREAPNRHYMVLAAKRLAALVRQIRLIDSNETVNIIAHSQGTLITLLAQAFLIEGSGPACRPADTLILIDSPYSLNESRTDQFLQRSDEQQTVYARAKTLANLTALVANHRHAQPPLERLKVVKGGVDNYGVTGPAWDPHQATRLAGPGHACKVFAERDNRGKVYLYFCPEDATVGLRGVAGIGCIGLPDALQICAAQSGAKKESVTLLSGSLLQRVFTRRVRQGKPVQVGTPPGPHNMRLDGETSHGTSGGVARVKQAQITENTIRTINGEALSPPFDPEMEANALPGSGDAPLDAVSSNERRAGMQSIDQVEAETALSVSELELLPPQMMPWPGLNLGKPPATTDVAGVLNEGKQPDDQCKVYRAFPPTVGESDVPVVAGQIVVIRYETPNEAKVRLMNNYRVEDSYHSAVMSGRRNHRCATAFDVAVGQGRVMDDPEWAVLLRAIADWRIAPGSVRKISRRYDSLDQATRDLVIANSEYYKEGNFPSEKFVPKASPPAIVSEIIRARNDPAVKEIRSNALKKIRLL